MWKNKSRGLFLCGFGLLTWSFSAAAEEWRKLSPAELYGNTSAIVVGSLEEELKDVGGGWFQGMIRPSKTLYSRKGGNFSRLTLSVRRTDQAGGAVAYAPGKAGIWILQSKNGRVTANHPQRFRQHSEAAKVLAELRGWLNDELAVSIESLRRNLAEDPKTALPKSRAAANSWLELVKAERSCTGGSRWGHRLTTALKAYGAPVEISLSPSTNAEKRKAYALIKDHPEIGRLPKPGSTREKVLIENAAGLLCHHYDSLLRFLSADEQDFQQMRDHLSKIDAAKGMPLNSRTDILRTCVQLTAAGHWLR